MEKSTLSFTTGRAFQPVYTQRCELHTCINKIILGSKLYVYKRWTNGWLVYRVMEI